MKVIKVKYDIAKEKGGQWYCHDGKVIVPGSYGDKKHAIKTAARLNGITTKEFLKKRKQIEDGSGKIV